MPGQPNYEPTPIDTDGVTLSPEVENLREKLAEHAHDVWAFERLKDGWSYGSERNDDLKQNPCLVPYNALPENEKEYDRKMAMNTLKAIVALGYEIKAPE